MKPSILLCVLHIAVRENCGMGSSSFLLAGLQFKDRCLNDLQLNCWVLGDGVLNVPQSTTTSPHHQVPVPALSKQVTAMAMGIDTANLYQMRCLVHSPFHLQFDVLDVQKPSPYQCPTQLRSTMTLPGPSRSSPELKASALCVSFHGRTRPFWRVTNFAHSCRNGHH